MTSILNGGSHPPLALAGEERVTTPSSERGGCLSAGEVLEGPVLPQDEGDPDHDEQSPDQGGEIHGFHRAPPFGVSRGDAVGFCSVSSLKTVSSAG